MQALQEIDSGSVIDGVSNPLSRHHLATFLPRSAVDTITRIKVSAAILSDFAVTVNNH